MPFAFRHAVISGTNVDEEGISSTINFLTDTLVNDMGWSLVDDRRAQPGAASLADTHKVVLSTRGETDINPTWYLTMASGTNAPVNSNVLSFHLTNAYDIGTHDVPGSGVQAPAARTGAASLQPTLTSNGHFNVWVSGDKEGVVLVWDAGNTFNHAAFGRARSFLNDTFEPFGLYYTSVAGLNPATSLLRGIVGNPSIELNLNGAGTLVTFGLGSSNEPRTGLGENEPSYAIVPLLYAATNGAGQRGAIGLAQNLWSVTPQATAGGSITGTILTSRTSSRKYLVFAAAAQSLAIRIE